MELNISHRKIDHYRISGHWHPTSFPSQYYISFLINNLHRVVTPSKPHSPEDPDVVSILTLPTTDTSLE